MMPLSPLQPCDAARIERGRGIRPRGVGAFRRVGFRLLDDGILVPRVGLEPTTMEL